MPFDLTTWKTTLRERLPGWKQRMAEYGVNSVYASLCAFTLWPVVEAAKGGEWAALAELGKVLAGIGGNLVASRLDKWKDEVDAARQLAVDAKTDPALREELDKVLRTLETVTQARDALSADDRQWFTETLRTELTQLGNLSRFKAHLKGAGGIAQGKRAAAAGKRGVANTGTITHSLISTGGNPTLTIMSGPSLPDAQDALARYQHWVFEQYRHLSLWKIDEGENEATGPHNQPKNLAQVYIHLLTTAQAADGGEEKHPRGKQGGMFEREQKARPVKALEAVMRNRHLVLLGDPGSGKSTFLNHLALCLVGHGLHPRERWLTHLPGWPRADATLLPLTIMLRDFARQLPTSPEQVGVQHLWRFIEASLKTARLAQFTATLEKMLEEGRVLLLLDGLDEITHPEQRVVLREVVAAWCTHYRTCRVIVTCRTLSYRDSAWQLSEFVPFTLAPFNEDQIGYFIDGWYEEFARANPGAEQEAKNQALTLRHALRRNDLRRLAPNPLLLTVMALVHTRRTLPDSRAQLYEQTVDMLLLRWEEQKAKRGGATPALRQLLAEVNCVDTDLKRTLWKVAYDVHVEAGLVEGEAVADIGELQLQTALTDLHPAKSRDWAYQMITAMKLRAGLLLERLPQVYSFPHRTFQEYLAGAYLATLPDFAKRSADLVTARWGWREALLLAVGRLVYVAGEPEKPLPFVAELCPKAMVETPDGWRNCWLAGDVLLEIGLDRARRYQLGHDLLERVRSRLVALLQGGHLSPVERAAAGDTLARLGDPRFLDEKTYCLPDDTWISLPENRRSVLGFIEIPAGPFLMGSDKQRDSLADDDECPQHSLALPGYYIARYPVTVAQFRACVEQSGYQRQDERSLAGLVNHSVASITWHDALRYCEWLTECLRQWEGTPEPLATLLKDQGWQVTLPSEAEWEKAARGTDGRIYPWGDEFDAAKANTRETGIGHPSAVGCFPQGASPSGCLDMAGNVWEWTRSVDGAYPYPTHQKEREERENLQAGDEKARVLRGGSFWDGQWSVRCACRRADGPSHRFDGIGFRVVVRP